MPAKVCSEHKKEKARHEVAGQSLQVKRPHAMTYGLSCKDDEPKRRLDGTVTPIRSAVSTVAKHARSHAPHSKQNFEPGAFSCWQRQHFIAVARAVAESV